MEGPQKQEAGIDSSESRSKKIEAAQNSLVSKFMEKFGRVNEILAHDPNFSEFSARN